MSDFKVTLEDGTVLEAVELKGINGNPTYRFSAPSGAYKPFSLPPFMPTEGD